MTEIDDPYRVEPRKRLTNKQRLQMFLDAKGICEICGTKIDGIRDMWDEHMTGLWLGGSNQEWNRKPVHFKCGRKKSDKENTERSKMRNVAEAVFGAKRSKGPPMPGSRRSKWKKHLDCSVTRR